MVSSERTESFEYAFAVVSLFTTVILLLVMLADLLAGLCTTVMNPQYTRLSRCATFLTRYLLLILAYFIWAFVLTLESFAEDGADKAIISTLLVDLLTLLTVSKIDRTFKNNANRNALLYLKTIVWTAYFALMTYFSTDLTSSELVTLLHGALGVSWVINILDATMVFLFYRGIDLYNTRYANDGYDPDVEINCTAIYCFPAISTLSNVVYGWQQEFPGAENLSTTWAEEITLYRVDNNEKGASATVVVFLVEDRYNPGLLKDMKKRTTCICVADSSLTATVKDQLSSQIETCARYGFEGTLLLCKVNGNRDAGSPKEDLQPSEFDHWKKFVRSLVWGPSVPSDDSTANFRRLITSQLRKPDGSFMFHYAAPQEDSEE